MELLVLNTNLEAVSILDNFESLIWTDRYCGFGDFEVYEKAVEEALMTLQQDYYILSTDSNRAMIVENVNIQFGVDDGNRLIVTGRSLESILDRRIIWNQTVLTGSLQNGIQKLLDENAISPVILDRQIPNLIFEVSTDPVITVLTIDAQFVRDNLYDAIAAICAANDIGFQITLSDTNQFVFKLYSGADRSYDQVINPYVVFSPNFENIISSSYLNSKASTKTLTVVVGEDDGVDTKVTVIGGGVSLSRREMYTDASSISQTVDSNYIPDADYIAQLAQKGSEDLAVYSPIESFDGQVDTTRMFKYGEDFYMGDIVQLASEYGIENKARVTELIHSQGTTGTETHPTFVMIS